MKDFINTKRVSGTFLDLCVHLPDIYKCFENFKNNPNQENLDKIKVEAENLENYIDIFKQTMAFAIEEIYQGTDKDQVVASEEDVGFRLS